MVALKCVSQKWPPQDYPVIYFLDITNRDMRRHDRLLLHDLFIYYLEDWHFFKIKRGELFGPSHLLDSALNLVIDFVNNLKENKIA